MFSSLCTKNQHHLYNYSEISVYLFVYSRYKLSLSENHTKISVEKKNFYDGLPLWNLLYQKEQEWSESSFLIGGVYSSSDCLRKKNLLPPLSYINATVEWGFSEMIIRRWKKASYDCCCNLYYVVKSIFHVIYYDLLILPAYYKQWRKNIGIMI